MDPPIAAAAFGPPHVRLVASPRLAMAPTEIATIAENEHGSAFEVDPTAKVGVKNGPILG